MSSECKKCGRILASFIDPRQAFGPDKIIPPHILANAAGLAILSVFKVGFLGSGRFGSGIVVSRNKDTGAWSAPSAIGTIGGGFGGQIGFELTEFVFILNDQAAVKTFAQPGNITLGGNVSIAAGPVGRSAEAAGAASLKSVSGVFAYSKTKGLFAGVSLEGSVLVERPKANEKMYGRKVTARELLMGAGTVPIPPQADPLHRVLSSRVFGGHNTGPVRGTGDMYNDVPIYDDAHDDASWNAQSPTSNSGGFGNDHYGKPSRAATWNDDPYDRESARMSSPRANPSETFDRLESSRAARSSTFSSGAGVDPSDNYVYSDRKGPAPARPTAPKPAFGTGDKKALPGQARAKFKFEAAQQGDLGFNKGDIITIVKRTDKEEDWWTGRIGNREGIFPSNYVEIV